MIGIIGGTGLYEMPGLRILETQIADTPFGRASGPVVTGKFEGRTIAFLARHGGSHHLLPSEINYRANLWALKSAGVRRVISVSAVGSLSQEIMPGDLAIPSQYLDWTSGKRSKSYFGEGIVAHVSTARPTCPHLTQMIVKATRERGDQIHTDRAYACVEGPRLGTQVESHFFRTAGCHLVGMTNVPEAFLAREAQLCYCTITIATDYDCWLDDPSQHATVDQVMSLYMKNLDRVKETLKSVLRTADNHFECECRTSLKGAVLTQRNSLNVMQKSYLSFLEV
ncbi:MAG: S-methyl-5'-thioadenosine phosphorylase [Methylotenera sp.]|nr:S-methyl-5'-thioadenosine phosphorylase [Oligoflexia bacterium]